jgi:flap endonuclease-1
MGLQIGDIVSRKEVSFSDLKGKVIAVDAYNAIYQFLSSIRQPDGTPLMDSKRRVTSHLSGLFYRNIALLAEGIKLIYVFDGGYHELKSKTHEIRQASKDRSREKYEEAKDEEDVEGMGKYSRGLAKLDKHMVGESAKLLNSMGVAVVMAPGEGEMQCSQLVKEGESWGVGSQDYDSLVVGGRLIQNLTLARKRKTRSGFVYIAPEMISYEDVLNSLGITGDQLISLAILVGTDFNPGGVKGLGPKKALTLVREKKFPVNIFKELEEQGKLDFEWKDVFEIFKKPNVLKNIKVDFPGLDAEKIKEILVEEHDFSMERVEKQLGKLVDLKKKSAQRTLF